MPVQANGYQEDGAAEPNPGGTAEPEPDGAATGAPVDDTDTRVDDVISLDNVVTPTDDVAAPGWDAINLAMNRLYPDQNPRHVGYYPPAALSTNLQGCSAYAAPDHWHYVTYGLSELYLPHEEDDPNLSGWGFEFTIRVPRVEGRTEPPAWPFTMLNELAKHVNGSSTAIADGDRFDLNAPVTGHPHLPDAPRTDLTVYAFAIDPELGRIDTPNGQVTFLQAVGVTAAQKKAMLTAGTAEVLAELAQDNPRLITDPRRESSPLADLRRDDHEMPSHQDLLLEAVAIALEARLNGNHPFGALLADRDGQVLLTAENTVVTGADATGHAETNLVRLASAAYPTAELSELTLYSSTEPCAMCSGAIFWSGIGAVVYALAETELYEMTGDNPANLTLTLPCREVFAAGRRPISVEGPFDLPEAREVHFGFWHTG